MANCPHCGTPVLEGARFCYACGAPVDGISAPRFEESDPNWFEIEDCDGGCRIKKYTGPNEGAVVIPSRIGGKNVKEIGSYAFGECHRLTGITIPDGVTRIGSMAFFLCAALTSVTIPDSVTEIGSNAFWICAALTRVTIPDSVTKFGEEVFYPTITTIHAPAGSAAEQYARKWRQRFQPL